MLAFFMPATHTAKRFNSKDFCMQIYLVGGAVRDQLLNLPSKDRDWVVVGATPEQMLAQGFEQVGADFPVFLHPKTHEEYALARTERKSGQGYQGFECQFDDRVTLEEDLLRRDLTINAMAQADSGEIIDPYGGQQDLTNKLLRHVSPAFSEDPLRVLRVARFAARFAPLGFSVAPETMALMQQMVEAGELEHLVAERVWQETRRALMENSPATYFEVLRECGALKVWFKEIDALFGVPQRPEYHPEIDCGLHTLLSLTAAHNAQRSLTVRWATLTHDLGKALTPTDILPQHIGHEARTAVPLAALQTRLKVPNDCAELAALSAEFHTHSHRAFELKPSTIIKLLNRFDVWRKPDRFEEFLQVCEADAKGRTGFEQSAYPQADYLRDALAQALSINAQDMIKQGFQCAQIKSALEQARIKILTTWQANQQ